MAFPADTETLREDLTIVSNPTGHVADHNLLHAIVRRVQAYLRAAPKTGTDLLVAATDSPQAWKDKADYVCDGTADNVEIQAALSALPLFTTPRYGTVRLAPGNYTIASTVQIRSFQQLLGSGWGTVLKVANSTNIFALLLDDAAGPSNHCQGAAVRYLKIDANSLNQTTGGGGIRMRGANRCVIDHVSIVWPTHSGITMEADTAGAQPWACELSSVMVVLGMNSPLAATAGYGIDLGDGEECEVHNCNLEFNGKSHIRENIVGNNSIHDNSFIEGSVGIESNGSRGRWHGNVFDSVKGHNLRITGNENVVMGNAFFNIGQSNAGNADGIALAYGASRNVFVGNRLSSHGTNGTTRYLINDQLDGGGNTHGNLFVGNVLRREGTLSGSGGVLVTTWGGDNTYKENTGFVANAEWHDVTKYGARNDQNDAAGTRTAVQAAIDACPVGGTVYFPPGIYRMEGGTPWQIKKRIRIVGAGFDNTTIEAGTNHNNDIFYFDVSAGTGSNGVISGGYMGGFKIDHRPADQAAMTAGTGRLIAAYGAVHWTFENIHFSRPYHIGLYLRGIPSGEFGHHNKVRGCLFDGGGQSPGNGQGLRLEGSDENFVTDCDFENNGGASGNPEDKADVKDWSGLNFFDSCCFVGGGQNQRHYSLQDANGSRLQGCIFDGSGEADMIRIQGGRVSITGCDFTSISAGATTTNTYSAIVLSTGSFSVITGNTFATDENTANNAKCRSFVREVSGAHHNAITGNTFKHNGNNVTNATLGTGVTETSGTGTIVANNVV